FSGKGHGRGLPLVVLSFALPRTPSRKACRVGYFKPVYPRESARQRCGEFLLKSVDGSRAVPVRHEIPEEQVRSMIGIVLVTHGRLASEFRAALEHVVGPQEQIESVTIGADDDIEQRRQDIVSATAKVDSGAGVVVLTDMFGGT